MRKVEEVLREIEELKKYSKTINDIANKMSSDGEVRKYMFETFGIYGSTMSDISSRLSIRANKLQSKLCEIKVDID